MTSPSGRVSQERRTVGLFLRTYRRLTRWAGERTASEAVDALLDAVGAPPEPILKCTMTHVGMRRCSLVEGHVGACVFKKVELTP